MGTKSRLKGFIVSIFVIQKDTNIIEATIYGFCGVLSDVCGESNYFISYWAIQANSL